MTMDDSTTAGQPLVVPPAPLAAHHQQMLEVESGITPAAITARGYWTATTKRALQDVGFTPVQRRVPALVLPIHGVDGQLRTHQSRPDAPRWGRDGQIGRASCRERVSSVV